MRVSDLFSVHNVILDANPPNKESLLERLAVEAESRIGCPRAEILDALQAREKIGSTALGKGVALPHTELRGAETPIILFLRLRRPIDFDAGDDEPVDLVFLVLWPAETQKGLLPVMSEICQALRDPQSLRRLRHGETPEAVVEVLQQAVGSNAERSAGQDHS